MSSGRSKTEHVFSALNLFFLISNLVLQVLDWTTSAIGYSRGINDVDPTTRWLIRTFGKYLGLSVEKVAYIAVLVIVFIAMSHAIRIKNLSVRYPLMLLVDLFLLALVVKYVPTIIANFTALGW